MRQPDFSPSRLRLPPNSVDLRSGPHGPATRRRLRTRFLKGPVPWPWLTKAARLPGRALHLGMALWFLKGFKRSQQQLSLSPSLLRELGVNRYTAYRGLRALEAAGLVSVERQQGRSPLVVLLSADGGVSEEGR